MKAAVAGIFALGFVAGCQTVLAPVPLQPKITLVPDAAGVLVQPYGTRIDFGRSPKGVIPVLDRELGAHEALPLIGCPPTLATRHRWGDLELTFTVERFVGWRRGTQAQGQICAP